MVARFKIKKFRRMGEYPRITEDYYRYRQEETYLFDPPTIRTVPLSHIKEFKDKKTYRGYNVKDLKALTGKLKRTGKWELQSILIPRKLIGR